MTSPVYRRAAREALRATGAGIVVAVYVPVGETATVTAVGVSADVSRQQEADELAVRVLRAVVEPRA